jgi:hypothetical protein
MSIGSDDSGLSYLTSYHCIGCNATYSRSIRHRRDRPMTR